MFKHYFVTAWRNLKKYRGFSLVNIGGLAIGLAGFWAITLYVADELSYDRYLPDAGRVCRAVSYEDWNSGHMYTATSSAPFAEPLKDLVPQIEKVVRVDIEGGGPITVGDKQLEAGDVLCTDSTFFDVFPYTFLYGNPATALSEPNEIVLTKTLAEKLFGKAETALGKTVLFNKNFPNVVTGIIQDVPDNTHLHFSAVRSKPTGWDDGWQYFNIYTYVLLKKGTDYAQAQAQVTRAFDPFMRSKVVHTTYRMELQPLNSIHLHSHLEFEAGSNGNISYVYIFAAAALLILMIAVINYMNLSTARSVLRVKEVGGRKAIGSPRGPLVGLFIVEAIIITALGAILGLLMVELLLPVFNRLSGKSMSLWHFGAFRSLGIAALFSLFIGALSGAYPALFLSGFGILKSLKGQLGNQSASLLFRKSLVTFQFVITIVMMSSSLLIYEQLQYVSHKDLGFNKDQVIIFHLHDHAMRRQIKAFREKLLESPLVEGVSGAGNPIGNNNIGGPDYFFNRDNKRGEGHIRAKTFSVDDHFLSTMQIPLVLGRNFSDAVPSDTSDAYLVNETLVKAAGWKNPIGQKIGFYLDDSGHTRSAYIVGVVKDFHIYSLQYNIDPLVLFLPPNLDEEDNVYLRISKDHVPEALTYVEKVFKTFDAAEAFDYHFLDQNFSKQYDSERKQGYVLLCFTTLAVGLACLGLFGLVSFSAAQRTREIGIRKVLGAETSSIILLLAGDLLKLVVLAALIAGPLAYLALTRWLRAFAYHIPVHWWMLILTGIVAAGIALLTMSAQAFRAARSNPVKALKYE